MNDVNTKSEVASLSAGELSCDELGAVRGGECTPVDYIAMLFDKGPIMTWYFNHGCPAPKK